jgi:hypothetical protein
VINSIRIERWILKKILYTVWDCIYPVVTYLLITSLAFLVPVLPGEVYTLLPMIDFSNAMILNSLAAIILIFTWFGIIYTSKSGEKKEPIGMAALFSTKLKDYVFIGWLGISLGICLSVAVSIFGISEQDEAFKQVNELIESQPFWLKIASVGIIIPIQEELMYRGLIYKNIEQRYDHIKAAVISSTVFAVMHMNLSQGSYAFLMGFVLAFIYQKTKNIYACITFHCSANMFAVFVSTNTVNEFLMENVLLIPAVLLCMIVSAYVIILYLHKEYRRNI